MKRWHKIVLVVYSALSIAGLIVSTAYTSNADGRLRTEETRKEISSTTERTHRY